MADFIIEVNEAILKGEKGETGEKGDTGDRQEVQQLPFSKTGFVEDGGKYKLTISPLDYSISNTFTILNILKEELEEFFIVIVEYKRTADGIIEIVADEAFDGRIDLLA